MRPTDLEKVRSLALFESMSQENFSVMLEAAYLQSFPEQVDLLAEGESPDFLHILVEGCVEQFASSNGRETTMSLVRPVSTFVLAAVIHDARYLMSARTYERSQILRIPTRSVLRAFESDEAFARSIIIELASCYRSVIKEYKNTKLRTGVERLANALLSFNEQQGSSGSLILPCDKRKLAALLSMTPENLSRALKTLQPYGVQNNGARIVLTDIPGLTILAKPNPLIDV